MVSASTVLDMDASEWEALEADMRKDEVEFELEIPGEGGETEVFFSDLSPDYVALNSAYTS